MASEKNSFQMKMIRARKQAQHNALVALCCILLIHFFFGRAIWQRMLLPEAACDYENDCESSCKSRSIYCAHLILVTVRKVYITLAILFSFLALCVSLSKLWPAAWLGGRAGTKSANRYINATHQSSNKKPQHSHPT